jgi:hypothetical protein
MRLITLFGTPYGADCSVSRFSVANNFIHGSAEVQSSQKSAPDGFAPSGDRFRTLCNSPMQERVEIFDLSWFRYWRQDSIFQTRNHSG